ncbi:MAG: L-aspartate oxidase [Chthonomonadales bacterium]|nr:L-aspartate oxidase [Chthonomonadales bacterium]
MPTVREADYLVIGSGIAGLTFALLTSPHGSTVVLTKKNRAESNTNYAQGGIAGVMADDDDIALHAADTLTAGAGLCHPEAVDVLVREGPARIRDLIGLGARFSTAEGSSLALGREGGHSRNRIVHAVDRTGWECERALLAASKDRPNLEIAEHLLVVDLAMASGRCVGAYALNAATGSVELFRAGAVLLAAGGCGRIYAHTTNPRIATGDGVAMAWRAGAAIANMEFIQFHPTTLYHPHGESFLISEAVRGEGGVLRTADGEAFMARYHPLADLAPRDVVARAIHAERLRRDEPCVYLDVTHLDAAFLRARFPTISRRCAALDIDITRQPIPVVPAAHYMCGGVRTDLDGRTTTAGLYAAGEVACTGVHGANRLASNSLLEAMVFGHRAASAATAAGGRRTSHGRAVPASGEWLLSAAGAAGAGESEAVAARLRSMMDARVGIVRSDADLDAALAEVQCLQARAEQLCRESGLNAEACETRNMTAVARLVVRSALSRRESRGLHYTTDYPGAGGPEWLRDTVLVGE